MRVESVGYQGSIADAIEQATEAEQAGFDTWWATETKSDVFLSAAAAAAETDGIRVGTGIAVALARNPMLVAVQANDIQAFSGGRFSLGLGACWTGLRSIVLLRAIARFAERRSEQSALPPLFGLAGTLVLGAFALAGALLTALMVVVFVVFLQSNDGFSL